MSEATIPDAFSHRQRIHNDRHASRAVDRIQVYCACNFPSMGATLIAALSQTQSRRLKRLSLAYALLALPAFFLALSAVFIFDAPGSEKSTLTVTFAASVAAMPVVLLLSAVGGAVCAFGNNSERKRVGGRVFAWLPVVDLVIFVVALTMIQALCRGSFACRY
jgi:hypothetical protein